MISASARPAAPHVPALDGLRGIAILMVMVFHFAVFTRMTADVLVDKVFRGIVVAGWSGVDLFFVLSGFLITGLLLDAKGSESYFRNFFARRILRIFPLYYSFLVLAFFVAPLVVPALATGVATQVYCWAYVANVRVAVAGWAGLPIWLGHFWSLAVEEQFYLVWPLLVLLLPRRSLLWTCAALLPFALALRVAFAARGNILAAYTLMPCRADTLAAGALAAIAVRSGVARGALLRAARVGLGSGVVALGAVTAWRHGLHDEDPVVCTLGYTLNALTFGSLLLLAVLGPPGSLLTRTLERRPLRFFGKYSYALYVFHQPVAAALQERGIDVPSLAREGGAHLPVELALQALGIGIALVCALVSWRCVEAPCLRLKRFFAYGPPPAGA